jgi:hypothetical protein
MPETSVAAPIPTILSSWHWGNLASVASAAINTFVIPTGDNVHGILLYFDDGAGAPLIRAELINDVVGVRMWLNGDLIFERTTTELLDEYKYHFDKFGALAAPLGVLPISCMNHNLPIWDQTRGAALGMLKTTGKPGAGPFNTLTMEVTMGAAVATAALGEVHVVTDLYPQEPTGMHVRRLRTTRDILGTGDNFIQDLPRSAYGMLAIHVADNQMDRVTVTADNRDIYRGLNWNALQIMMNDAGRIAQVGYSHIPFDLGNDLLSCLPFAGLSKFIINYHTTGAPGAGTVILTEEVWDHVRE